MSPLSDLNITKLFKIIDQITSMESKCMLSYLTLVLIFKNSKGNEHHTNSTVVYMCNGRKNFYLFNPTHQIKAVRYSLFNYDFYYGNKIGQWDDIIIMYKRDKSFTIRCCPKLTDKHVHLTGFTKMKVKYAMQILSYSVSATVLTYVSLCYDLWFLTFNCCMHG